MVSPRRRRRSQAGFTLIEVMIVVVIVAILAAIAIPAFMHESSKTKANAEVAAFFAELSVREEQYKVDNGSYLSTVACPAGTPGATAQAVTCEQPTQPWELLNVQVPTAEAYCQYTITASTGAGAQLDPVTGLTFNSPTGNWYYLSAKCDIDGDGTFSSFLVTSVDSTIQKVNEGD